MLANRVRRQPRGLTEDWIRTHTTGDVETVEPRHWFSDGSGSEHSSLSGSEFGWLDERDPRTPKAPNTVQTVPNRQTRHTRDRSSIDTLKPDDSLTPRGNQVTIMATPETERVVNDTHNDQPPAAPSKDQGPLPGTPTRRASIGNGETGLLTTPARRTEKPLPKAPAPTPHIKKKVPWKGKNIMVLLPRDEERGLPGQSPMPLTQTEVDKMFNSWKELGYGVEGFDLLVEDYQPPGTDDSQSREAWPDFGDIDQERTQRTYKVTLPDLNKWKNYVNELQEAKLRALGVSFADEEPSAPPSPPPSAPSRQPSAQYPALPFSPPIPPSSASSNHGPMGYPFPGQFNPGAPQSPALPSPVPFGHGKFSARQSISFPPSHSPFQFPGQPTQGWSNMRGNDSPSFNNLNGMMSPQSPFGVDGIHPTGSPAFVHQRQHSLQYPMLPHQSFQHLQSMRESPRLQEVREDDEEEAEDPMQIPKAPSQNADLQAEIEDAEYHLEEQLRNQLEHEDYNPQAQAWQPQARPFDRPEPFAHERQVSMNLPVTERFSHQAPQPIPLHHPRPHSRGHSLTQNFFRDRSNTNDGNTESFHALNQIPEVQKTGFSDEVETNRSNLGTPIQKFDFSNTFGQHQRIMSTASNPWDDAAPISSQRRPSHESKPSLSKLNVKAPEFKFNPTSNFNPGQSAFSFGGQSFQPAVFEAVPDEVVDSLSPEPIVSITRPSKPNVEAPAFTPGQSAFSFSTSGPKFRPDAPAFRPDAPSFTPFQLSLTDTLPFGTKHQPSESIFGEIQINTDNQSMAVPEMRPSSRSPAIPPRDEKYGEDDDGRPTDDSRAKRAKSFMPDGDDVPLFAEQPRWDNFEALKHVDTAGGEGESALPADTSMSSAITSDQFDTKTTTAVASQMSPVEADTDRWAPFEFQSQFTAKSFSEARTAGDHGFRLSMHKKSLSATAPVFTPGAMSYGSEADSVEIITTEKEVSDDEPVPQPVSHISLLSQSAPARSNSPPPNRRGISKGLGASRFASPPPKPKGLSASRFASASPPPADQSEPDSAAETFGDIVESVEVEDEQNATGQDDTDHEAATFEDIDSIMQQLGNDPSLGVRKVVEQPLMRSPTKPAPFANVSHSPAYKLEPPTDHFVRESSISTTQDHHALSDAETPMPTTELEDPFIDQPRPGDDLEGPETPIASDWEGAFSADEHDKLQSRAQFFDSRVNEVVGNLLASRLEPLEQTLFSIQDTLALKTVRSASSRRDVRTISEDREQSDADDEDEEPIPRRSMSPRRDRTFQQIRVAVMEGLAAQQRPQSDVTASEEPPTLLKLVTEMKEHMVANLKPDFGEKLKVIAGNVVQSRLPSSTEVDLTLEKKISDLQARFEDLERKLEAERSTADKEIAARRAAEDAAADLNRQLQAAETRVEVEIINRSVFDQRVADLEEKLRSQEGQTEEQIHSRRAVEDKLAEVQRCLRTSSEEENRLRELNHESNQRIRFMEQANGKASMKMSLLEASQTNGSKSQADMANKVNALEADLRNVRQDNIHWRAEAERADETARRHGGELAHVLEENKHLQKSLSTLATQLEENERLRESWRSKFMSLQEDMGKAAREIAEDNARRIKKDQAMLARQEVLDARLQAEAKTRERLEIEMERLQNNERTGMRAANECQRLENLLGEMRTENHKLHQRVLESQREFEEARESGASEVKRTRNAMHIELDSANHHVNVIREELEEQNSKLRAELDSFKLEADTAKARNEMLLEEAEATKAAEAEDLKQNHQNELEDLQARYEQQRNRASEDSAKTEQNLLERLSFSSTKIDHLQDRIHHLEEKLEVSKEAAAAAVAAAKSAGVEQRVASPAAQQKPVPETSLPEKISPQALRESIMVLQEQLQAREQRIEELEQTVAKADPDAAIKISKRDDEITWLRELLAVRQADLQDIIAALSSDDFDRERVKDAAIRLTANLQMEEQERERAWNGGSAIRLPNIAQNIASSPRVAQTTGAIAAAWGNWRKGSLSGRLNSTSSARNATPSKLSPFPVNSQQGGLMTPPASGIRSSPLVDRPQPTAFGSTGRRYASQSNASSSGRPRGASNASCQANKFPAHVEDTIPRQEERDEPMTPPMMRPTGYDSDAQAGDFDDDDFFEEN